MMPREQSEVQQDATGVAVMPHVPEGGLEVRMTDDGIICAYSFPNGDLLAYSPKELVWSHISVLLPELEKMKLICDGKINPRLRFLSRIGRPFWMKGNNGRRYAVKLYIHDISQRGRHYLRALIFPVDMADMVAAIPA
jgi:hypothetical protein